MKFLSIKVLYALGLIITSYDGISQIASSHENDSLYRRAVDLFEEDEYEESIKIFKNLSKQYLRKQQLESYVACQNAIAKNLWLSGGFRECLDLSNSLISKYKDFFNSEELWNIHYNKGVCFNRLGEYDSSKLFLSIALKYLPVDRPSIGLAKTNAELGQLYLALGLMDSSATFFQNAVKINTEINGRYHISNTAYHNGLGRLNFELNEIDKAEYHYREVLDIFKKNGKENMRSAISAYLNMGTISQSLGLFQEATEYYKKVTEGYIREYGQKYVYLGVVYNNIGIMQTDLNNYTEAIKNFEKAKAIFTENFGRNHRYVSIVCNGIANTFDEMRKYRSSLEYYSESLEIVTSIFGKKHRDVGTTLGNIAATYIKMANYDTAKIYLDHSIEIQSEVLGLRNPSLAQVFYNYGDLYFKQKYYDSALVMFQKSLISNHVSFEDENPLINPPSEEFYDRFLFLKSLMAKVQVYYSLFQEHLDLEYLKLAYEFALDCDRLGKRIFNDATSVRDKLYLAEAIEKTYRQGLPVIIDHYRYTFDKRVLDYALFFIESSKSITLRSQIDNQYFKKNINLEDSIMIEEDRLKGSINNLKTELLRDDLDNESRDSVKEVLFDYRRIQDKLLRNIGAVYPEYYDLLYAEKRFKLNSLQSSLEENSLLLEYFFSDSMLYTFVIRPDTLYIFDKQIGNLKSNILELRDLLSNPESSIPEINDLSYDLYSILFKDVQEVAKPNCNSIIIVTDGELAYVPFGILKNDETEISSFLIDDFNIIYRHFASSYKHSNKRTRKSNILAIAPSYSNFPPITKEKYKFRDALKDLTWNTVEVERVVSENSGRALFESDATEMAFKNLMNDYSILHLSMHALIDDEDPMNSKFLFNHESDSVEDGYLHAFELYNMDIEADLAVLSSCNSGYGQLYGGEGIMSLARAFAFAGTPSVVMSHWQVDDKSTSELMILFYEYLSKGMTKSKALRKAKLSYLESTDPTRIHPFFWGAFVVVGDDQPVFRNQNNFVTILVTVLLFMILLWLSGDFRKVSSS